MKFRQGMQFSVILIVLMISSFQDNLPAETIPLNEYASGLKILNYEGGTNIFHPEATGFASNWTASGNTYDNFATYDFSNLIIDDYNILLLPGIMGLTTTDINNIVAWYTSGEKLLWIGGDSDYAGFYQVDDTANPLLEAIGSALRVSSIAIEDSEVNDGAVYRVLANETGVSSNLTDFVTDGFDLMMFHGPAAVHYEMDGIPHDLRNATLGVGSLAGVDIVINSSKYATALDQDLSLNSGDFYAYSDITGHYPMLVTDQINNSIVVVSAEAVWTDYKFMYGTFDENGADPQQGSMVVDRLVNYYFLVVLQGQYYKSDSSSSSDITSDTLTNSTQSFTISEIRLPGFGIMITISGIISISVMQVWSKKRFDRL